MKYLIYTLELELRQYLRNVSLGRNHHRRSIYYWRPLFIGDPHGRLVGDPRFSLETSIFLLETRYLHWRPHSLSRKPLYSRRKLTYFHWRPFLNDRFKNDRFFKKEQRLF